MKILLVYPPFCPPTMAPYSTSYLKGFLTDNLDVDVTCLDLNSVFHRLQFSEFYDRVHGPEGLTDEGYGIILSEFEEAARPLYSANNKAVVAGEVPMFFSELLERVLLEKPDLVAFSLVYSSQCFYVPLLAKELGLRGIGCVAGGPAVNDRIKGQIITLSNEIELVEHVAKIVLERTGKDIKKIQGTAYRTDTIADYSDHHASDYLSREMIIPLKTTSTCFYKQCTFCTHFAKVPYMESSLAALRETIIRSGAKRFFFIDDMIPKQRLLEIADTVRDLGITWWVQLRPTRDLLGIFATLHDCGLRAVCWGVESGNQRILDLMKKGTHVDDIPGILSESRQAGIKNMLYIMFGFPSETKEEFLDTIELLKRSSDDIYLVSTSIFGLQEGGVVLSDPQRFGITEVKRTPRDFLNEKIEYTVKSGLDKESARRLRGRFSKTIAKLQQVNVVFKDYKEQVLLLQDIPRAPVVLH